MAVEPRSTLSPARRRAAFAIRWLALPLAAFAALAPLWVLRSEYRRTAHLIPTPATVLEARVVSASRGGSEWDAYVRYRVSSGSTERPVRVWTHFTGLHAGDTITLLVDPTSSHAEDDTRAMAWVLAASGMAVAAFMVAVGYRQLGAMLERDRSGRR